MPKSRQFSSSCQTCRAASSSRKGRERSWVGVLWSAVATVLSARRTFKPRLRRSANACGEVTSCTRCRSMYRMDGRSPCASPATMWLSQIFWNSVRGLVTIGPIRMERCAAHEMARNVSAFSFPCRPFQALMPYPPDSTRSGRGAGKRRDHKAGVPVVLVWFSWVSWNSSFSLFQMSLREPAFFRLEAT